MSIFVQVLCESSTLNFWMMKIINFFERKIAFKEKNQTAKVHIAVLVSIRRKINFNGRLIQTCFDDCLMEL